MKYPAHLLKLLDLLRKFPGVGYKSAERYVFDLLTWTQKEQFEIAEAIRSIHEKIQICPECGCLYGENACLLCLPNRQASQKMCIIAFAKDAFAIEGTGEYKGLYHVLGGLLSPLEGFSTEQLDLERIQNRIKKNHIKEVIIALDSTLEGDATSLFLKQELETSEVQISRLAFGLPMGSALDYVDGGTLARAFSGRASF